MAIGHSSCRLSGKCQQSEAHSHALTSIKTLVQLVQEGAPGVIRVPLEGGYEVLEGQCPPLPRPAASAALAPRIPQRPGAAPGTGELPV